MLSRLCGSVCYGVRSLAVLENLGCRKAKVSDGCEVALGLLCHSGLAICHAMKRACSCIARDRCWLLLLLLLVVNLDHVLERKRRSHHPNSMGE